MTRYTEEELKRAVVDPDLVKENASYIRRFRHIAKLMRKLTDDMKEHYLEPCFFANGDLTLCVSNHETYRESAGTVNHSPVILKAEAVPIDGGGW